MNKSTMKQKEQQNLNVYKRQPTPIIILCILTYLNKWYIHSVQLHIIIKSFSLFNILTEISDRDVYLCKYLGT